LGGGLGLRWYSKLSGEYSAVMEKLKTAANSDEHLFSTPEEYKAKLEELNLSPLAELLEEEIGKGVREPEKITFQCDETGAVPVKLSNEYIQKIKEIYSNKKRRKRVIAGDDVLVSDDCISIKDVGRGVVLGRTEWVPETDSGGETVLPSKRAALSADGLDPASGEGAGGYEIQFPESEYPGLSKDGNKILRTNLEGREWYILTEDEGIIVRLKAELMNHRRRGAHQFGDGLVEWFLGGKDAAVKASISSVGQALGARNALDRAERDLNVAKGVDPQPGAIETIRYGLGLDSD